MSREMLNAEDQYRFWSRVVFLLMTMVILAFSSDLRIGLNLQFNTRPDFQFFELVCILFGLVVVFCSPWLILQGRVELENTDYLLILFLINAFFLALWAEDLLHNISRTKDFFWAFTLYGVIRYGPLNQRALNALISFSVLIASIWALLGIVQWLGVDKDFGGDAYRLFLASRALYKTGIDPIKGGVIHTSFSHGIYLYPQNFIYYLICPFFLCLGLVQKRKIWIFPSLIIFLSMLGTLSKTFILLLVIFVCLCALNYYFRNTAITLVAFAAVAGFVVLAVVLLGHYPFWKQALETFVWRTELWADAFAMLRENPWLIIAGDGTKLLASEYSRVGYPNPHNMFIYLLIEYGVLGAFSFFAFLSLKFKQIGSDLNVVGSDRTEMRTLFWGLIFLVSMGVVDDIFVQTQVTALFFFYLGLITRMVEQEMSLLKKCVM